MNHYMHISLTMAPMLQVVEANNPESHFFNIACAKIHKDHQTAKPSLRCSGGCMTVEQCAFVQRAATLPLQS